MIKEVIETILNIAYKHISVNHIAYKRELNINDSHNDDNFQFIITDDGLFEKQIVQGVNTLTVSGYIISFAKSDDKVIDLQDEAMHILLDIIEYIGNDYNMEIRDYSAVGLSEYSDNNCSGIYFTLKLVIPTPINLCDYETHFIEKPIIPIEYTDIADSDSCTAETHKKTSTLKLNPLRL